jgi:hypothetical protein
MRTSKLGTSLTRSERGAALVEHDEAGGPR